MGSQKKENILFTGGTGVLGGAFMKFLPHIHYPSSQEFDVTNFVQMRDYITSWPIRIIIHGAAFTSPPKVDRDPIRALTVNIIGSANVARLCIENGIRLIYMSTDYVFDGEKGNYSEDDPVFPVNKYAWSKLGGECSVRMHDNSLIIRTSFGQVPFPYAGAYIDQWTSRETVDKIAQKIISVIDMPLCGVIHIAGDRKSVYDYATHIEPSRHIKPISILKSRPRVPRDTSLNTEQFRKALLKKQV